MAMGKPDRMDGEDEANEAGCRAGKRVLDVECRGRRRERILTLNWAGGCGGRW